MGFDEGSIILDSPNGAYFPGQALSGRLEFNQDNVKTFRGIYVKIKGFCKLHWTSARTTRVGDRNVSYTVNHESYEEYIDTKIFLVGSKDGEHQLQPGRHIFPFQCHIPPNCPSSFEGKYGHIRYQVQVVVDRAFKFDQEKMATFRIVAPLDLNTLPNCKDPIQMELLNTFCCWCVSAGVANTLVKLPVSGFCPGQIMPIEVSCNNNSNVEIDVIKFEITKKIVYHAEDEPDTRYEEFILETVKKGTIPGNSTRNWKVDIDVPVIDVLNMIKCRYIDIEYLLQVQVETSGCHEDTEESHPIVIGNVPIIGFQDDIQNPLHDQMPQAIGVSNNFQGVPTYPPVITTQPGVSSYPIRSPYPGYPGVSPQPYPSYPGVNAPYPGAPAVNPSAYPSNTPYSGDSPASSYPGVAAPYPAVAPNTPIAGSKVLKGSTYGFVAQGEEKDNEASRPLLTPGGAVPYPSNFGNPYATATAPELSTPDNENKDPLDTSNNILPNPPYNPEFTKNN